MSQIMSRATRWIAVIAVALAAVTVIAGCPKPSAPEPPQGVASMPGPGMANATAPSAASVITAKGSDTLLQAAQALAEAYKAKDASVDVSVSGGGSGVGFTALTDGTTDIADASRKITDEEVKACQAKGFEPKENVVGYDGIAVIVNKANPIEKLTVDQLSDIYVATIKEWKALGGKGEVVLLSRESTSGTYQYFKENVVQKGDKKSTRDYAASAMLLPSTDQVRSQVASTEGAIGYIGLGYLDDSVKAVPIVDKAGKPVLPSVTTVHDGTYPISRPLFMYTKSDAAPAILAFIEWTMGAEGQKVIADQGFVPLK
jgi:phosphate transport system substrate-binding protein